jgi:hypothetical protein
MLSLFVGVTLFVIKDANQNSISTIKHHLYKTWKVERLYKNGKVVVDDKKIKSLKLRINPDSTAEWISNKHTLEMKMYLSADGRELITNNGETIENVETIYELSDHKLRFGKKHAISQYEYILVPVEKGE